MLTQAELAEVAGVSERTVHSFLKRKTWPRGTSLVAIERALGWPAGYLAELAARLDSEVQTIDDSSPSEQRLLELVQELRGLVDGHHMSAFGRTAQRELGKLAQQLADLGGGGESNVTPLRVRPVAEVERDIQREEELKQDTIRSGVPGWEAIVAQVHDAKLVGFRAELEVARRFAQSFVTGS